MSQIVAVSKSGKNALTESNPNNFIFHSSYNTFKIIASLSTTVNLGGGATTVFSISHNLDYIPSCYVFSRKNITNVYAPGTFTHDFIDAYFIEELYADSSKAYAKITNNTGGSFDLALRFLLFETPV